jgi:MoxR-like ATPase
MRCPKTWTCPLPPRLCSSPGVVLDPLISPTELIKLQEATAQVEVPDDVLGYAWALARATRPGNDLAPDFVETWIRLGVSPQGLVALISAAKARALLRGRSSSTRRDLCQVTQAAFRHRLHGNEEARAAGLTVDRLISMLLERISLDGEYRPEQAV